MDDVVAGKIENFFRQFPVRSFKAGHILLFPDDDPQYIYHLVSGKVQMYDINVHGDEIIVNIFKPPAFFPMSWAINKTPNQYFYGMQTPVTLRQAPVEDSLNFLQNNPDVVLDLLGRVYKGTDVILRRMTHLMGGNANTLVIFELVTECRRTTKAIDGVYNLDLSEGAIASRSGLTRETVNRVIKKLKADAIIKVSRNRISVIDFKGLEALLGHLV